MISTIRYTVVTWIEKIWYKVMRLDRNNPIEMFLSSEYDLTEAYHATPKREHYFDQAIRFVFYNRLWKWLGDLKWKVNQRLTEWMLFRVKELTYESHHYVSKSGNMSIDGYLTFKWWRLNRRFTLDLLGLDEIKMDGDRMEKPLDLNHYGKYGYATLIVPKKTFSLKDIDKIIMGWYKGKVEFKYRHWTRTEGLPTIKVDLKVN